ncbi:cupin domain-containing protein [Halobacteriales archaeon Cl-PHB]
MQEKAPADSETVEAVEGVHLTPLASGDRMTVVHFHIEPGATVPDHSHDYEQAGYVTKGTFTFVIDGEEFVIGPGESFVVPSGVAHTAENRADVPVSGVDVFSPPMDDPDWLG